MGTTVRGPWLALALLVCTATSTAACSATAGTPSVNTDYSHATVTAQHTVEADGIGANAPLVVPSPDGSKVYSVHDGDACIITLADSHQVCANDGPGMPSVYWASWAPDGHAIALTDDFRLTLHEPDLWVMDATDGSATNLTDDGATDVLGSKGPPTPVLDLMPVWRDDSTIVFARQEGRKTATMAIASVPAAGGEVTVLTRIGATISFLNAIALQPDGDAVAYSVADADQRAATVYLHPLDATTGDTAAPGPAPSGKAQPPANDDPVLLHADYDASLLTFSADGQYLLADNLMALAMNPSIDDPEARVIQLDGRAVTPVAQGTPAWYPTWSPTGHALAFLSQNFDGTLQTVTAPGGKPRQLADATLDPSPNQRLAWTASGLLARSLHGMTILSMDQG